jgi:hypothetical protein
LKVLGFGVLALAVAVPIGLNTLTERFGDTPFTAEEDQRAAFERAARAMAADHPLGVGANLFVSVNNLQGYADRAGVAWNFANRSAPVHNAYLLARAETGWIGEIAFAALFLIPTLSAVYLSFAERRSFGNGVVLGSGIAIAAVGIHNLFEFVAHTYDPLVLLVVNLAIVAGHIRAKRLSNGRNHAPGRAVRGTHRPRQLGEPRPSKIRIPARNDSLMGGANDHVLRTGTVGRPSLRR